MKIFTHGARQNTAQINRIDQGFRELGHELVPDIYQADLIYSNNPWWDSLIDEIGGPDKKIAKGKVIFNILDLCPQDPNFPLDKIKRQLSYADAATCISNTVKYDCITRLNISPTVIYQPMKQVFKKDLITKYPYKYLFVGRVNDPNKRTMAGAAALHFLGVNPEEVITVGTEPPNYGGVYAGEVTDEILNDIYNSVEFVIFPSHFEGIGLPVLESMAAGKIPIITCDLNTRQEFLPSPEFSEYLGVMPNSISIANFISFYEKRENKVLKKELEDRLYNHFQQNWAQHFTGKAVAEKILKVYEQL